MTSVLVSEATLSRVKWPSRLVEVPCCDPFIATVAKGNVSPDSESLTIPVTVICENMNWGVTSNKKKNTFFIIHKSQSFKSQ